MLMGANPIQEFVVNLQELLKNGQLVDKFFAFSPVKPDGGEKKIHEPSGVPTNMTMLGKQQTFQDFEQWEESFREAEGVGEQG